MAHDRQAGYPSAGGSPSRAVAAVLVLALAGCGAGPVAQGVNDPMEAQNREIHAFNRGLDRFFLRPGSTVYDTILPAPVERGISNASANLGEPSSVVNSLLQGRIGPAAGTTLRFAVNSTVGLAGLFDPATAMGLERQSTDFGETLHVWGVGEGNYVEFPLIGPSTERDLVGTFVDLALDPMRYVLPPREANVATALAAGSRLGDRAQYSDTVDSILYESADSYAQARLMYLQNRRYELGQTSGQAGDDDFLDPYEDPYGD